MIKTDAEKLLILYHEGYNIKVSNYYLDDFVTPFLNNEGDICYRSIVFNEVPLEEISKRQVRIFKEVTDEVW